MTDRSRSPGALALSAGTMVAFLALAVAAATSHSALLAFDRPITDAVVGMRSEWLTVAMKAASVVGSRPVLIGVLLGLIVWAMAMRRCSRSVLIMLLVFLAAITLESVIKALIGRPRPEAALQLTRMTTSAFPSGHATASAAVYGFLPVIVAAHWPERIAAWATIAIVGFSRVYLGVHWTTDVIGGILLGAFLAAAGSLLLQGHRLDPRRCPGGHAPASASPPV